MDLPSGEPLNPHSPGAIRRRLALDELPFLVAYVDCDHQFQLVNRSHEEWFGVRRRNIVGSHVRDIVGAEVYETLRPYIETALSGEAVRFETLLPHHSGTPRQVVASYVPDFDDQGNVRGFLGIVDDVTGPREAAEKLVRSEKRYRSLALATPGFVWSSRVLGGDGDAGGLQGFTGLTNGQLAESGWLEAVHPEDRPRVAEDWRRATKKRQLYEATYRLRRADGVYRRMFVRGVPVFDDDGSFIEWIGTATDIEDEEHAKELLVASDARAARLFEADLMGMVYADRYGRFHRANDRFLEMTGYSREEIESGTVFWSTITPPEYAARDRRAFEEVVERGSCKPYEKRYRHKGGSLVPVLVGMASVGGSAAEEWACFVLDLTPQKRADAARMAVLERERRRASQLRRLARVGIELGRADSVEEILHLAADAALEIGAANMAAATLAGAPEWPEAHFAVALSDEYAAYREYDARPDGSGIYALVCEENRPLRLTRDQLPEHPGWKGFGQHAGEHPPLSGLLAVPIIGRDGRNRGVLMLSDKVGGEFDDGDEAMIVQLAQLASAAIEQAELVGQLRTVNAGLELLSNVAAAMVRSDNDEGVLREAASLAVPGFADLCVLDQLLPDRIERSVFAREGFGIADLAERFIRQAPSLDDETDRVTVAVRDGVATFMPEIDPSLLPAFARDEDHLALLRELGPVSLITAPLAAQERIFGSINFVLARTTRRYTQADFEVAQEFGRRLGASLERARLVAELQKANSVKDEVLGMVSHELRTPLTTLKGNANVLRRHGASIPEASRLTALADIERDAERLQRIVENMLILARVEVAAQAELEPLLLRRVLEATVAEHRAQHPDQNVILTVPQEIFPVLGHETYLRQIVVNLLSNAAKYADASRPVDVSLTREAHMARVTVADRGRGLPAGSEKQVFEPFFRSRRDSARAPGIGLGLTVCKRLVEAQGGTISAQSREGGGTEFSFTVPIIRDGFADD